MSAIVEREFDRNLRPRERHRGFPKLALRRRSADHPMIMFFLAVMAALMAMALVPPSGTALTSFGISSAHSAPAIRSAPAAVDARRPAGLSEIEIACHGQAWGAETTECLATIAKDSGRTDGRKIRVITGV